MLEIETPFLFAPVNVIEEGIGSRFASVVVIVTVVVIPITIITTAVVDAIITVLVTIISVTIYP